MSAVNIQTQIPNSITTLEQLAAWVVLCLCRVNPTDSVLESDTIRELIAQNGIFRAADGTDRLFLRLSLELDPEFKTDSRKLWMSVKEISQAQIPVAYTTN
ncbi:hypothetical protein [Leptolyngbya sp. NIES-2104]|uniref:hypothetical protein n=1 Tax=Leptolyngbya sp. NIES-2104 TaxID=1552121 RepID=UPI0006EC7333|nr:hypothetical protein [Leptolyngbya sp. NIES-2104]GAP99127.1 hypothetical protein NIES2104_56850 [Leptolyngbya sp. NIES-2104]